MGGMGPDAGPPQTRHRGFYPAPGRMTKGRSKLVREKTAHFSDGSGDGGATTAVVLAMMEGGGDGREYAHTRVRDHYGHRCQDRQHAAQP